MQQLDELRKELNLIDQQIILLLNHRMKIAETIGRVKQGHHLPVTDPIREEEIYRGLEAQAQHLILKDHIREIYRTVMTCSKQLRTFMEYPHFPFSSVGILGLGLLGGSMAKALHAKDLSIPLATVKRADHDTWLAYHEKVIGTVYATLQELVDHVDLIILATPLSDIVPLAQEIQALAMTRKKPLIVMDIGSVKTPIAHEFEKLTNEHVEFMATHPIAGTEYKGFEHSHASLFIGAPWVITPHSANQAATLDLIKQVIQFFGAHRLVFDPVVHDERAALISHVPCLLSLAIYNFASQIDPQSLEMAGPGFASMTRLAKSNAALWQEICHLNKPFIKQGLDTLIANIYKLSKTFYEKSPEDTDPSLSNGGDK